MRATGPGNSAWPLITTVAVVVIAIIAIYLLFFQR